MQFCKNSSAETASLALRCLVPMYKNYMSVQTDAAYNNFKHYSQEISIRKKDKVYIIVRNRKSKNVFFPFISIRPAVFFWPVKYKFFPSFYTIVWYSQGQWQLQLAFKVYLHVSLLVIHNWYFWEQLALHCLTTPFKKHFKTKHCLSRTRKEIKSKLKRSLYLVVSAINGLRGAITSIVSHLTGVHCFQIDVRRYI